MQRCCSTFLRALPLGVTLCLSVMLPRYTREWMENSSGTKGLQCVASAEICSFLGRERRRLSPCFESQMLATSQHWEEGGAGLNCQALGSHRKADFCLMPKMKSSCCVAFPIWKVRVFSLQLGKSTAQGDEGM